MAQERALFKLTPELDNASYEVRSAWWIETERARQLERDDPFAYIPDPIRARWT